MVSKARVQKRLYYKIGEACKALGIQPYVLRYWETEFPALSPSKSRSGQRVYSEKELEIIRRIKELLYEEGYTIAGAKKKLEAELAAGGAGDLGEEVRDEEEAPEEASVEAAPPPAPRQEALPAPPPEEPAALDTDAGERIQTLVSGIEEALQEAREILALLGPKPP
ncbi:MAG TPA: MerR family transcriptional regulator [Thermoanaerobaculia bacterium]|jgi:DNA-binding transcriptional MerR regulator|nr:MerR family transcriptional regulator [Thermoanaerobaculia bacterium]